MDNIEQALRIAKAQKNRSRRHGVFFVAAALLLFAVVFLAYRWLNRPAEPVLATPSPSVLVKNAPVATPKSTVANLSPALLQAITDYQEALSGLEEHQRFGEDAVQAISELKKLRIQLETYAFSTLKSYYEETLAASKNLLDEVKNVQDQLRFDIENAYKQRNADRFQEGLHAYDALGQDLHQIAQWRDLGEMAPQLFPLLKQAKVHQVQNSPSKELVTLQRIQAMGFKGENVAQRITELRQTLKSQAISKKLHIAQEHYAQGQLHLTKSVLNEVLKADPANAIAKELRHAVGVRLAQQEFAKLYSQAAELAADDRWLDAKQAYNEALSIQADHKQAKKGLDLAEAITRLEGEMQALLKKPLYLNDKQVSQHAQKLLQKATGYTVHSPRLKNISNRLHEVLVQMNTRSKIVVTSDGKARIEVRGVGYIEPTMQKIIFLTPGYYEFYSHCRGHTVGMSQLEVPVNELSLEVFVACGPKI